MTDELPVNACPSASTPTIFPDGRVYACIGPVIDLPAGHPLLLWNLKEKSLCQILDEAELNPVLQILRVWGPGKLLAQLKEKGYGAKLPWKFVKNSICNLCYTLMADSRLCTALTELAQDPELMKKRPVRGCII